MRYFKGQEFNSPYRNVIVAVYPEPQEIVFGKKGSYLIELFFIGEPRLTRLESEEDLTKMCHISREIGKEEFELYRDLGRLANEFYMHGFTGGFPCKENVKKLGREIVKKIDLALDEIEKEES